MHKEYMPAKLGKRGREVDDTTQRAERELHN